MITIDNIPHAYHLEDYQSFVQVVQAIDLYLDTKTYIFSGTLKQINDNFFKRDIHASINDEIQKLSDTEIRKKTGVYNFKRLNNNYNSEKIIKTWCVTYERFFRGEH